MRFTTLDEADLPVIHPSETNTCDDPIEINPYVKFCINLIQKLNACPPDIESQSGLEFAEKHTFPIEGSAIFLTFSEV